MNNILSCLEGVRPVIIAGHTRPDGDCVGACMGLWHYLRDNYPEIEADVRLEPVPESYKVIAGVEQIIGSYEDDKVYDLFIALDASDKGRLAGAQKYFDTAKHRICIDHHISNPGYADENMIVSDASSTCEVLTGLMAMEAISYDAAVALYIGIICDTGVFKYSNTSRHTMDMAGCLMEKGIPYSDLIDDVFYRKSYKQNKILGYALQKCRLVLDNRMIVCVLEKPELDRLGAGHGDLEGIIDQLRLTRDIEVALLASASDTETNTYKFSMRSNHFVDVAAVAGKFGGGGHVRAAGFSAVGDINEIYHTAEALIKEQLDTCTME